MPERMERKMFNFRIIPCADGTEIIDMTLETPYESLTPSQMVDYVETDKTLACMERMEEKKQKQAEWKRKMKNPLYRIVCRLGGRCREKGKGRQHGKHRANLY